MTPLLQVLVFSRDRPLQLDGYLSSLAAHLDGEALVRVLYRVEGAYAPAYARVRADHPEAEFVAEQDFAAQTRDLLRADPPLVLFGCDDVVFTGLVNPAAAGFAIGDSDLLGFSLRLGCNVTRSLFVGVMPQPYASPGRRFAWDVTDAASVGDWAYPWELDGTVYPADFVRAVADAVDAPSPNQLEARGAAVWCHHTDLRRMGCWVESRCVVPTVNRVQTDFLNPIAVDPPLSPELLLACYEAGLRLDHAAIAAGGPYDAIHIPAFALRRAA